jgi:hypothetical protein
MRTENSAGQRKSLRCVCVRQFPDNEFEQARDTAFPGTNGGIWRGLRGFSILRREYTDIVGIRTPQSGYTFIYGDECIRWEEYAEYCREIKERRHALGLKVVSGLDHLVSGVVGDALYRSEGRNGKGGTAVGRGWSRPPMYGEPWCSVYLYNYGISACTRIAGEHDSRGIKDGILWQRIREVFNEPVFQTIRGHLARGEFSEYCRRATSCPFIHGVSR